MRIRAGFVTDSAFDPLPGAKFSMRTIMSFERQLPTKRSRGRLDRLANVVDDTLHERRIVALGHHPDQGLGARFADDQASPALERGLGGGDSLAQPVPLERGPASPSFRSSPRLDITVATTALPLSSPRRCRPRAMSAIS